MAHRIHASALSGVLSKSFECLRKNRAACAVQPAETPLADPPPFDRHEALAARWARGDLYLQPGDARLDPVLERLAVGLVDQDLPHSVEIAQAVLDEQVRFLAVGRVSSMDDHAPAQPQRVDNHVPLSAVDLLVAVRAALYIHKGGQLNRLAVNAQQAGRVCFALALALHFVQLAV